MSFDADETSTSGSRPIDLYTITTPTATYWLTSHAVDVTFGGQVFSATTLSRGNQTITDDPTGHELIVYLAITHPLVQRFAASGVPEREVSVVVQRLQTTSGTAAQIGEGFAQSLTIAGQVAQIRIPSTLDDAIKLRLPVISASLSCVHVLYDAQCQVSRGAFAVSTTIVSQTSTLGVTTVVVSAVGGQPDGWAAPGGELVHVGTGERRQVLEHVGTTLTINVPFVTFATGDAVTLFASCNHSIGDCHAKFANVVNFVGAPYMLAISNPWAPTGVGLLKLGFSTQE